MLTIKQLEALSASDHGRTLNDGESLSGVVYSKSGGGVSVRFRWAFKFDSKLKTIRVGTWPATGLATLRKVRDELRVLVNKGINPIAQRGTQRVAIEAQAESDRIRVIADQVDAIRLQQQRLTDHAAMDARQTLRQFFEHWIKLALTERRDKGVETRRSFEKDVFPFIGDMAVEDVQKKHITQILDTIKSRATEKQTMVVTQRETLADLRQFFNWAIDREVIDVNPTDRISKAKLGTPVERDRFLIEEEVIELMRKLPESGLSESAQGALLIQFSTVCRIGEILTARWADVDMERHLWRIPADTAKNGKGHTVDLSDFALGQFQRLHASAGLTDWVFPASTLNKAVCTKSVSKQVADRQRTDAPMSNRTKQVDALVLTGGKWTPHDLRRTGATMMAELGALPDVIERCMNHAEPSKIRRIYQRASYAAAMRNAWQLLGDRLELLQNKPDNVLTLVVA